MMAGHTVSSLRTKELLASALRRQMEKKPLSRITVSDIMAETGLNRKTFYYHFKDIYDLADGTLQEALHVASADNRTHEN